MRNSLLATVAAAALVAGTVMVSAQGTGGGGMGGGGSGGAGAAPGAGSGAGSPPSAAPSPSTAPAEKMDRGGARSEQPSGQRAQQPGNSTTGQGAQERGSTGQTQPGTERSKSGQTQPGTERGQSGQTQPGTERGQTGQQMNRDQAPSRAGQGEGQRGSTSTTNERGSTSSTTQRDSTSSVSLNTEQRTKIRETVIKGGNVNRVNNVNFNISVGTAVPRSVHLVTVPSTIVEIHPAWRGYLYFVVNDEIVIVEPGTLRIVAVIT
jgi:hypothetical protein